jgi:hypothetical protein
MDRLSPTARIKAAIILALTLAAVGMFIWGQDRGSALPVISAGPPPTATQPLPTPFTGYGY